MSNTIIIQKYNAMKDKLDNTLEANGLIGTFVTDENPIMLTVKPNTVDAGQTSMFPEGEENKSSLDAKLSFIFQDGDVIITTDEKLVISESLMNKLKNIAKKMHYLYLQAAFESFINGESSEDFTEQFEDEKDTAGPDEFEDEDEEQEEPEEQ